MSDSEDADDLSGSDASGPAYKRPAADDEAEEAAPGEEEPSGDSEPEGEDIDKSVSRRQQWLSGRPEVGQTQMAYSKYSDFPK